MENNPVNDADLVESEISTPAAETENVETEITEERASSEVEKAEANPEEKIEDHLPAGIKKRLSKLTKQKHEARDNAAEWKAQFDAQKQELDYLRGQMDYILKQQPQEPKLSREAFGDDEQGYQDYVLNEARKELQLEQRKNYAHQQQLQAQAQNRANMWQGKIDMFRQEIPDIQEVLLSSKVPIPAGMDYLIESSPYGPKIAYALAKNPELVDEFHGLTPREMDRAFTRFEIHFENDVYTPNPTVAKVDTPTPSLDTPQEVTNASAPTPKTGGGSGRPKSLENMSMKDFIMARNKQIYR